ncbi:glycolytic proteins transcriptional activator gcr1 [Stylosanthes scabra]|uniref:Glycolytic proteins transcriptional activator gcr1 n=1 Tax=Stylosanthes scabra TaxID=79078 RepID=A0ABU6U3P3_9FABA|nr:glycolytic proteins transcriptional activator gcr1 [Stylosanthes scabra]
MAIGMSSQPYASDARDNMRALNRWGYYPLILIGSWVFGAIKRIHDFFEPNHQIFWFSCKFVIMCVYRNFKQKIPKEIISYNT